MLVRVAAMVRHPAAAGATQRAHVPRPLDRPLPITRTVAPDSASVQPVKYSSTSAGGAHPSQASSSTSRNGRIVAFRKWMSRPA